MTFFTRRVLYNIKQMQLPCLLVFQGFQNLQANWENTDQYAPGSYTDDVAILKKQGPKKQVKQ